MSLKDWFKAKPYWLKGGLIGLTILIFLLLNQWFKFSSTCSRLTDPLELFNVGGGNCSSFSLTGFLIFIPLLLIIAFFIGALPGALAGLIYGKINSKFKPFKLWGSWLTGIIGSLLFFMGGNTIIEFGGATGIILEPLLNFIVFFL